MHEWIPFFLSFEMVWFVLDNKACSMQLQMG